MEDLNNSLIFSIIIPITIYLIIELIKSFRVNPNILLSNPFYLIGNRGSNLNGNQKSEYQGVLINAGNRPSFVTILNPKIKGYDGLYFITKQIGRKNNENKEMGGLGSIILKPGEERRVNIIIEWYDNQPQQTEYEIIVPVEFTDKKGKLQKKDLPLKFKIAEKSPDRPN